MVFANLHAELAEEDTIIQTLKKTSRDDELELLKLSDKVKQLCQFAHCSRNGLEYHL
jgi:hypothetical protein